MTTVSWRGITVNFPAPLDAFTSTVKLVLGIGHFLVLDDQCGREETEDDRIGNTV